jgi:formate dehydrogenase (coenzyme F420) beta subunit
MKSMIPVQNSDALGALRGFLRLFLESGAVDALYVPLETDKGAIVPALVTNPDRLDRLNPFAPVMPINGARAVSALTGKHPPARIAAVLRPCEARALIELVKLQQASLEGLTVIAMDCAGTFENAEFIAHKQNGGFDLSAYLAVFQTGEDAAADGLALRKACQMCVQPVVSQAGVSLQLFGADLAAGIPFEMDDELAARLSISPLPDDGDRRKKVLDQIVGRHQQLRDKELLTIRTQMNSNGGIAGFFDACIRCHNCMTACPICYCKTCLFRTAAFDHEPEHYFTAARRKGAARMLGDTLLFHMTRMNHMSASCVSCGMCTSACPSDIQVGAIFSAVGEQVQAAFSYNPGRDPAEPLPLITFQADEWTQVGEAK